jgi:hypothetical protein
LALESPRRQHQHRTPQPKEQRSLSENSEHCSQLAAEGHIAEQHAWRGVCFIYTMSRAAVGLTDQIQTPPLGPRLGVEGCAIHTQSAVYLDRCTNSDFQPPIGEVVLPLLPAHAASWLPAKGPSGISMSPSLPPTVAGIGSVLRANNIILRHSAFRTFHALRPTFQSDTRLFGPLFSSATAAQVIVGPTIRPCEEPSQHNSPSHCFSPHICHLLSRS